MSRGPSYCKHKVHIYGFFLNMEVDTDRKIGQMDMLRSANVFLVADICCL